MLVYMSVNLIGLSLPVKPVEKSYLTASVCYVNQSPKL